VEILCILDSNFVANYVKLKIKSKLTQAKYSPVGRFAERAKQEMPGKI